MNDHREPVKYICEQLFYLRNIEGRKMGCMAIGFRKVDKITRVDITGSLVSNSDQFSRKAGRGIAVNRLRSSNPATRKLSYNVEDAKLCSTDEMLLALELNTPQNYRPVDCKHADEVKNNCIEHAQNEIHGLLE